MSRTAVPAAISMRMLDGRHPTAGSGRSRRVGALVLGVVVIAVVIGKLVLGVGITGSPRSAPLPAAPPIGSCLLVTAVTVAVTPCTFEHTAEVAWSWNAGEAPDTAPAFTAVVASTERLVPTSDDACTRAEADYLRSPGSDRSGLWTIATPRVQTRLIAAPAGERSGTAGWTACIVESTGALAYTGSIRADGLSAPLRPAVFGSCVTEPAATSITDCVRPHQQEILGWFDADAVTGPDGLYTGPVERSELDRSCAELASVTTMARDPTYGGRLTTAAEPLFPWWAYDILTTADTGQVVATAVPRPLCVVEVSGAAVLTGTVIGLGDRPLPVT